MNEYIALVIIVVQWMFLAWYIYGARVERKRLTDDLINVKHNVQPATDYAPIITMPHPDTGHELTFYHLGNGAYGPPESSRPNNVEEVEGM